MAIDVVQNLGDDALQNLFDIIFPPFPGLITGPDPIRFRITNLSIPATGNTPYEVHYKTQMFTKPSGKVSMPNEFTFTFRVDKFWRIYTSFKNWKNIVADTRTGVLAEDVGIGIAGSIRVPVTVIASDSNGVPTGGKWLFEGCYVQELGEVGFDYTAGDPITVDVTMAFMVMNDLLVSPV